MHFKNIVISIAALSIGHALAAPIPLHSNANGEETSLIQARADQATQAKQDSSDPCDNSDAAFCVSATFTNDDGTTTTQEEDSDGGIIIGSPPSDSCAGWWWCPSWWGSPWYWSTPDDSDDGALTLCFGDTDC